MVENVSTVTVLLRRSVYDQLGPFNPAFELVGFEDGSTGSVPRPPAFSRSSCIGLLD